MVETRKAGAVESAMATAARSATIVYDGNNLRVVKDNDGVVTHYHYDLQGRLFAETGSDAAGPGMTIDTAAHSIVIQDGGYAEKLVPFYPVPGTSKNVKRKVLWRLKWLEI